MTNSILIGYDPFAMESRVNIYKNGKQEHISVHSNLDTLTEAIITMAYENDIYEVMMNAPFAFTSELAKRVHAYEQNQYSQQKITVGGI